MTTEVVVVFGVVGLIGALLSEHKKLNYFVELSMQTNFNYAISG